MSEKIISNITNQIQYNNIPKYNNLEKYNNFMYTLKYSNKKSRCKKLQKYNLNTNILYNQKFCNNLYNCLNYYENQKLTNTNSFKFLNILNNLKNV